MAKTYAEVQKQLDQLRAEAAALKAEETAGVVARIKEAIAVYGITADQLGLRVTGGRGARGLKRSASSSSDVKYADGLGGVWGGRGPRPAWLRDAINGGKVLEDFAVGRSGGLQAAAPAAPATIDIEPSAKRALTKRVPAKTKAPAQDAKAARATKVPKAAAKKAARPAARRPATDAAPGAAPDAGINTGTDVAPSERAQDDEQS